MRIGDWSSDVCSSDLTVNHLARKTTVPLLIVRDRPFRPYDRLLVATDFSPSARVALETCISFFPAASITLFHAYVVPFAGYLGRSEVEREFETYGVAASNKFLQEAGLVPQAATRVENGRAACREKGGQ